MIRPDDYRASDDGLSKVAYRGQRRSIAPKGLFLKGPVDWEWLARAGRLPGRALHVGLVLHFLSGLRQGKTVELGRSRLADLGVNRFAGYRGLKALETAGLVSVERRRGAAQKVTILPVKQEDSGPCRSEE